MAVGQRASYPAIFATLVKNGQLSPDAPRQTPAAMSTRFWSEPHRRRYGLSLSTASARPTAIPAPAAGTMLKCHSMDSPTGAGTISARILSARGAARLVGSIRGRIGPKSSITLKVFLKGALWISTSQRFSSMKSFAKPIARWRQKSFLINLCPSYRILHQNSFSSLKASLTAQRR